MSTRKLGKGTLLLALFGLILTLGVAWKVTQGQDGIVYYACVNNSSGTIKVWQEPQPCSSNEFPIEWNSEGRQGPPGNLALAGQVCTEGFIIGFDDGGNIVCSSSAIAETEVCDYADNDRDGLTNEGLAYCINGQPAPNTDGSACRGGYIDGNELAADGCEERNWDHLSGSLWGTFDREFQCTRDSFTYYIEAGYVRMTLELDRENISLSTGMEQPGTFNGIFTDLETGEFTVWSQPLGPGQYYYELDGLLLSSQEIFGTLWLVNPDGEIVQDCGFSGFVAGP